MAKRRAARRARGGGGSKKGSGNAVYWVGGSVAAAAVGIAIYEATKKPQVTTTATTPAVSTTGPISSVNPVTSTPVTLPGVTSTTPLGLQLPDTGGSGLTIVGTPAGAPTPPAVATPSYVIANPSAPRIVHITLPGASWKPASPGVAYAPNTRVRMQLATPPDNWTGTIRTMVMNNTFGAWSVMVYPPGANIPADWPGGTDPAWRLDFYLNKSMTLVDPNNRSFGMPSYWVYT